MPTKPTQFKVTTRPRMQLKGDAKPVPRQTMARGIRDTWRWKKFSKRMRNAYPLCMAPFCKRRKAGAWPASKSVHHIQPLARAPELAFDESNTVPVCDQCHGWIEAIERRGYETAHLFDNWEKQGE